MYWFCADHHLGHKNILAYDKRPFANLEEMTEQLVQRHNQVVGPRDIVYILGDFAYGLPPRHMARVFRRLHGRIRLLNGNHDRVVIQRADRKGVFDDIKRNGKLHLLGDYAELKIQHRGAKRLLVMFHYPIHAWNCRQHGAIHLHGHSHGNTSHMLGRVDCGVPCWDWYPASLDAVLDQAAGNAFSLTSAPAAESM